MSMNAKKVFCRKAFCKKVFFAALFGICWGWSSTQTQAQNPNAPEVTPPPVGTTTTASATSTAASEDHAGTGLSSWITYERNNCCTGLGNGVPIMTEFFTRIGPAFPVGGEYFGKTLSTGWMIEGGVR